MPAGNSPCHCTQGSRQSLPYSALSVSNSASPSPGVFLPLSPDRTSGRPPVFVVTSASTGTAASQLRTAWARYHSRLKPFYAPFFVSRGTCEDRTSAHRRSASSCGVSSRLLEATVHPGRRYRKRCNFCLFHIALARPVAPPIVGAARLGLRRALP